VRILAERFGHRRTVGFTEIGTEAAGHIGMMLVLPDGGPRTSVAADLRALPLTRGTSSVVYATPPGTPSSTQGIVLARGRAIGLFIPAIGGCGIDSCVVSASRRMFRLDAAGDSRFLGRNAGVSQRCSCGTDAQNRALGRREPFG